MSISDLMIALNSPLIGFIADRYNNNVTLGHLSFMICIVGLFLMSKTFVNPLIPMVFFPIILSYNFQTYPSIHCRHWLALDILQQVHHCGHISIQKHQKINWEQSMVYCILFRLES